MADRKRKPQLSITPVPRKMKRKPKIKERVGPPAPIVYNKDPKTNGTFEQKVGTAGRSTRMLPNTAMARPSKSKPKSRSRVLRKLKPGT